MFSPELTRRLEVACLMAGLSVAAERMPPDWSTRPVLDRVGALAVAALAGPSDRDSAGPKVPTPAFSECDQERLNALTKLQFYEVTLKPRHVQTFLESAWNLDMLGTLSDWSKLTSAACREVALAHHDDGLSGPVLLSDSDVIVKLGLAFRGSEDRPVPQEIAAQVRQSIRVNLSDPLKQFLRRVPEGLEAVPCPDLLVRVRSCSALSYSIDSHTWRSRNDRDRAADNRETIVLSESRPDVAGSCPDLIGQLAEEGLRSKAAKAYRHAKQDWSGATLSAEPVPSDERAPRQDLMGRAMEHLQPFFRSDPPRCLIRLDGVNVGRLFIERPSLTRAGLSCALERSVLERWRHAQKCVRRATETSNADSLNLIYLGGDDIQFAVDQEQVAALLGGLVSWNPPAEHRHDPACLAIRWKVVGVELPPSSEDQGPDAWPAVAQRFLSEMLDVAGGPLSGLLAHQPNLLLLRERLKAKATEIDRFRDAWEGPEAPRRLPRIPRKSMAAQIDKWQFASRSIGADWPCIFYGSPAMLDRIDLLGVPA